MSILSQSPYSSPASWSSGVPYDCFTLPDGIDGQLKFLTLKTPLSFNITIFTMRGAYNMTPTDVPSLELYFDNGQWKPLASRPVPLFPTRTFRAKLLPLPGEAAQCGSAVSLSADGNTVAMGCPDALSGQGAVYVHTRGTNHAWTPQTPSGLTTPVTVLNAKLGKYAVVLSGDGMTLYAGATGYSSGQGRVYFYTGNTTSEWAYKSTISSGSGVMATFGRSIATSVWPYRIVVGAPTYSGSTNSGRFQFHVSNDGGTSWVTQAGSGALSGFFACGGFTTGSRKCGTGTAMSGDGTVVLVGAPGDTTASGLYSVGATWMYRYDGTQFSLVGTRYVGTGWTGSSLQGTNLAIDECARFFVTCGPGDNSGVGACWTFEWSFATNIFVQTQKLMGSDYTGTPQMGSSVAMSALGTTIVMGGYASDIGAFWVFNRIGSQWIQAGPMVAIVSPLGVPQVGYSIAIDKLGGTIAIGAPMDGDTSPGDGAVYIYT
jgi:hypothetical protein